MIPAENIIQKRVFSIFKNSETVEGAYKELFEFYINTAMEGKTKEGHQMEKTETKHIRSLHTEIIKEKSPSFKAILISNAFYQFWMSATFKKVSNKEKVIHTYIPPLPDIFFKVAFDLIVLYKNSVEDLSHRFTKFFMATFDFLVIRIEYKSGREKFINFI